MIPLTDTISLRAGDLDAELAPGHGMVATSLRHAGDELLDVDAGGNGIVGIPLLHPWANRLSGHRDAAACGTRGPPVLPATMRRSTAAPCGSPPVSCAARSTGCRSTASSRHLLCGRS